MDNKMAIDRKILEELNRYNSINKYIFEQDELAGGLPPAPEGDVPPSPEDAAAGAPPAPPAIEPTAPVDVENDPDVEKIDSEGKGEESESDEDSEELDITELVNSQKDISQKQDQYFEQLFGHLENLESKLGEMDQLMNKVNSLEDKLEKYRPKTPQEKLELRSLDSGPYNQKLSDFFVDKETEMEKSGKNEYVLTTDDVQNFTPSEIKTSFSPEPKKNFGF
jgi:DNA repair exonuclease SbcCD ATPase subunit